MSDEIDLKPVQRCLLLVLMAEAREVPNVHLTKVRGLTIKKKEHRTPLEKAGLINVRQKGNGPFSVDLTDKGWRVVKEQLGIPTPKGLGSTGAALYAVLDKVGQFIERSNISLAEFFTVPANTDLQEDVEDAPDLEARIRKAYGALATRPGAWVMLDKLRDAIRPATRDDVDAALVRLNRAPDVRLVPESNQKVLTDAERAAAVSIGNQDKHAIAIGV